MTPMKFHFMAVSAIAMLMLAGCGSPTPTPVDTAAPPPPPAPAAEPKSAAEPAKREPDPFEKAIREAGDIIKRYGTVYASVTDDATADKAIEEIDQMTGRLKELAVEIGKMPVRPGQEKHAVALQTDLTQLQTAQLTNPDMQRVLSDPDLGLKFVAAHQSFVTEGLLPLGQAVVIRQSSVQAQPEPNPVPETGSAKK